MAKGKKGNVVSVDFEGVESYTLVEEGDHTVKAIEVSKEPGNEHDYLAWQFEITGGQFKGKKLYTNTSLSPNALWNLRGLLEAMGVDVPDGKLELNLDKICEDGEEFKVTVEHERYEGKTRARITDYIKLTGDDGEDGDGKDDAGDKDEGADEPDFDEMDADELEAFVDDKDLDVDLDDFKKLKDKRAAVEAAWEKAQKANKKGGGKASSTKRTWTEDAINEMGTKELEKVVTEAKLGIELDGSTKSKRRAVVKALKSKDMLED